MTGLAGVEYTSASAWTLDVERLLRPSWQFVCHESDLPAPGTAMRFDFCGRSAVVLRTPELELSASSTFAAIAARESLTATRRPGRVVHRWQAPLPVPRLDLRLRGSLVQVPRESNTGLDRATSGLTALEVASLDGWVFVAFDRPDRDVPASFGEWSRELADYSCPRMRRLAEPRFTRLRANWKVV
jgi:phenylpropionate dioxygenase-like ring-hydroxylating dioxygenase large terminal subunit